MDKSYYDWLEVSKEASNEVIEKAYKTLVKKYHPDLQDGETKILYEETLKHINEAYETLSDPIKKASYDSSLKSASFSEEKYHDLYNENQELKNQINDAVKKAYYDAYIQDLKNRGYKIKYKKTYKDYLRDFIALIIFIFICFILWQIPPVRNYFISLYNDNIIVKFIVDLFRNMFNKHT